MLSIVTLLCSQSQENFHPAKLKPCAHLTPTAHSSLPSTLGSLYATISMNLTTYINGIIPFFFFVTSLFHNVMSSSFIHVACVRISLLLRLYNILSYVCTRFHLSISGHFNCFHLLAIVSNAAINTGVQIFLHDPAPSSSGYMLRDGIAGWCGIFIFNFLRNYRTVFVATTLFCITTNNAQGFNFSTLCQHL